MLTTNMKWSENGERPNDEEFCACCDKFVFPENRHTVEVTTDMSKAIHPREDVRDAESGGFFTVGSSCAKKYLKGFATK